MAKSRLEQTGKKIAKGVEAGYKKIEEGVVSSYQNIEDSVVEGFTKMTDKFVGTFMTKEGESVEDAKERMNENAANHPEK